jgi:dihydroorotase
MKIHIKNGRLIDPASKTDKPQDLFIGAGRIVGVGNTAPAGFEANSVLDASGCIVCPGLVDLSPHGCASRASNTGQRWNPKWPPPPPVA